jgi:hypothetical protein
MWRERLVEISGERPRLAWALWMLIAVMIAWLHLFMLGTRIGDPELWLDESSTYGVAAHSAARIFTLSTEFHSQPPLYYLLLHFVLKINSERWFIRGALSWFPCFLALQFILFYFAELNLLSRVFLCLLFIFTTLCQYLSSALRPYGLAVFLTLVSSVMLVRMLRDPTRRRAVVYVAWTVPMLYTMAFDLGVLLAHGLFLVIVWLVELRHGLRATLRRHRFTLLAMVACVVAYLPYLLLAYHYQYRPNPGQSFQSILSRAAYTGPLQEHLGFDVPWMMLFYLMMAVAVIAGLLARDKSMLAWLLVVVVQMAFVWVFIVGRSVIGMQGRYLAPGYVGAIVLAAFGFQQLVAKTNLAAWLAIPLLLLWAGWPHAKRFHVAMNTPSPIGKWASLHREMATHAGKKVIFFYIGYAGQDFEYEVRKDPSVVVATMRGQLLASGGDNHLNPDYVSAVIDKTHAETSCYYYWTEVAAGPYTDVFLPAMKNLGYAERPPIAGNIHVFCRPE